MSRRELSSSQFQALQDSRTFYRAWKAEERRSKGETDEATENRREASKRCEAGSCKSENTRKYLGLRFCDRHYEAILDERRCSAEDRASVKAGASPISRPATATPAAADAGQIGLFSG